MLRLYRISVKGKSGGRQGNRILLVQDFEQVIMVPVGLLGLGFDPHSGGAFLYQLLSSVVEPWILIVRR